MEQMARFQKIRTRFDNSLFLTIEEFRKGKDHQGLDGLFNSMDDLECLLEINRSFGAQKMKLDGLLPILQELCERIKNKDIVGMTDLLEFTLYPMVKELTGEDGNENCQAG